MKRCLLFVLLMVITIALIANSTVIFGASNVVSQNGQLKVSGGKLCNSGGSPIQLKGMSSMGLQWYPWSAGTVTNLVNTWGVTVVRAACYVAEGGYLTDPSGMTTKVKTVVDAAISNGIYVVVDWHTLSDTDPNTNLSSAKTFFQNITSTYKSSPNVIYEICNEPNGSTTWDMIKNYANQIIPVIRANAPNSVIIVGTPTWSQNVRAAADSPLTFSNICYTLHFYAGTHGASLRSEADYAMSKSAAIFVTEWGTSQASGTGGVYTTESDQWINWMATNRISWCNWSLCPKAETSAALVASANINGPWSDSDLSESGKYVKSKIGGSVIINPTPTPVRTATPRVTPTPVRTATPRVGTTPTPVTGTGNYVVTYSVANDWGSGATVNVTIKNNTTTAVNGWTLAWTFSGNQTISNCWNASYTQSGTSVSVKDAGFNANIPANGGTASFGFNLNYSGTNAKPTSFTLNGKACQVQ